MSVLLGTWTTHPTTGENIEAEVQHVVVMSRTDRRKDRYTPCTTCPSFPPSPPPSIPSFPLKCSPVERQIRPTCDFCSFSFLLPLPPCLPPPPSLLSVSSTPPYSLFLPPPSLPSPQGGSRLRATSRSRAARLRLNQSHGSRNTNFGVVSFPPTHHRVTQSCGYKDTSAIPGNGRWVPRVDLCGFSG